MCPFTKIYIDILYMCVLVSSGCAGCYNLCKPAWHDEAVWRHTLSLEDQQSGYGKREWKGGGFMRRQSLCNTLKIDLYIAKIWLRARRLNRVTQKRYKGKIWIWQFIVSVDCVFFRWCGWWLSSWQCCLILIWDWLLLSPSPSSLSSSELNCE